MPETQEQKIERLAKRQYQNWREKRFYETGAVESPQSWFYFQHPTHSDWYKLSMALKFITAAKKYGVDPYDFTALGISESGLGNLHPSNPTRVDIGLHFPRYRDVANPPVNELIDFSAKYLADKLGQYKDKLSGIQAYSGTGKVPYSGQRGKKYFGKTIQEIDLWRDKPQAKRVLDISSRLKKQPEIVDLLDQLARVTSRP